MYLILEREREVNITLNTLEHAHGKQHTDDVVDESEAPQRPWADQQPRRTNCAAH